MKKTVYIMFSAMLAFLFFAETLCAAEEITGEFNKYEVISTPTSPVAGIDVDALVSYKLSGGKIKAFNIENGKKLFEFEPGWKQAAPFCGGKDAIITGGEGSVIGFVNKSGKLAAEIHGDYLYHLEYSNGMVCLIDKTVNENVYSVFDRSGKEIAGHFFAPECELSDGSIVIANAGGGHSLILKDGTVSPLECRKNIIINDGVSLCGGVYENINGSVYSFDGKLVFENAGKYSDIAPVNRKFAVASKEGEEELCIVNFKDGKEIPIKGSGFLRDCFFTNGDVCDGGFFIGNTEKSVLVNSETGEIISAPVSTYTRFYSGISAVTDGNDAKIYRLMKSDGSYIGDDYEYATDFKDGFSLTVKTEGGVSVINAVYPKGNAIALYSCGKYKALNIKDDRAELEFHDELLSITALKTKKSAVYIGEMPGSGNVYTKQKTRGIFKTVSSSLLSLAAIAVIAFVITDIFRRRKKRKEN